LDTSDLVHAASSSFTSSFEAVAHSRGLACEVIAFEHAPFLERRHYDVVEVDARVSRTPAPQGSQLTTTVVARRRQICAESTMIAR
jgi:hypothetical protein